MFFTFIQNNSGGEFVKDENLGKVVVIEACCHREANAKAKKLGIYFNGCQKGKDCNCCGDRWNKVDKFDADEVPQWYCGEAIVYYADGTRAILSNPEEEG